MRSPAVIISFGLQILVDVTLKLRLSDKGIAVLRVVCGNPSADL